MRDFLFLQMLLTSPGFFKQAPQKIISLVPSQTELLHYLGLEKEVIAITKFCVHPAEWFATKTKIGGTKNIHIDLIKKLQPDLIIANKEENVKDQVVELAKEFNVWVTDVNSLEDALAMIKDIAELTYKPTEAEILITRIKTNFSKLDIHHEPVPAAYLIWQKPYMTVGGNTFISDMMRQCGLQNIFDERKRYPEINLEQLHIANCNLVLLSSEPYPFKQKHADEMQKYLPGKKIILVDGEMFSWYGSRLLHVPEYFKNLLNH